MFPLNFRLILTSTATKIFLGEMRSSEVKLNSSTAAVEFIPNEGGANDGGGFGF